MKNLLRFTRNDGATYANNPPMSTTPDSSSTRQWYDRLSGVYDRLADSSERPARIRGLRLLDPQAGESLLEIGYGTGHALIALGHAVRPGGEVRGIDLSEGMRSVAQARLEQEGIAAHVALEVGDARSLPYADGQFDGVFLSFTLELFHDEDIPKVLAEIRRVLRPDGRLVVVSLSKDDHPAIGSRIYEKLHAWFPQYIDCHPIDLDRVLEAAGFEVARSERFALWGIPGEAVRAELA